MPTPLLDITQSLHVACSMAAHKNTTDTGIVYVLGFEAVSPNIQYSYYTGSQLIRLLSVMPKTAKRPFYQEGYLVSNFPQSTCFEEANFANRLLAKFSFNPKTFWTRYFKPMPEGLMFPKDDPMKKVLEPFIKDYAYLK
jgi:hypothetical protein